MRVFNRLKLQSVFLVSLGLLGSIGTSVCAENASNPLSKGRNTDLRFQKTDGDGGTKTDYFIDGAFMASDSLKLKYELHYNEVSSNRMSADGLEKTVLKAI